MIEPASPEILSRRDVVSYFLGMLHDQCKSAAAGKESVSEEAEALFVAVAPYLNVWPSDNESTGSDDSGSQESSQLDRPVNSSQLLGCAMAILEYTLHKPAASQDSTKSSLETFFKKFFERETVDEDHEEVCSSSLRLGVCLMLQLGVKLVIHDGDIVVAGQNSGSGSHVHVHLG